MFITISEPTLFQHLGGFHFKPIADPDKRAERDVDFPALNGAVVGSVHLYVVSECVLTREARQAEHA